MIKKLSLAAIVSLLAVFGLVSPAYAALTYYYGGAGQVVTDSIAAVNMTVHQPTLTAGDFHTLAELAAFTGSGPTRQIVEIGWNVDPTLYPTPVADKNKPHLFVGWWKDNAFCGYNNNLNAVCGASGYTTFAGTSAFSAGAVISAATTAIRVFVQHTGGAWWFWAGTSAAAGDWIGYVNDTSWGASSFSSFTSAQVFGEVAANVAAPTTQMGNGLCATSTVGASFGSMTYTAGTPINLVAIQPTPTKYTVSMLGTPGAYRSLRYGGDGSCP